MTAHPDELNSAPETKLIIGLGNPGKNYSDTRHNIGFMVLDELAHRFGVSFTEEKRWKAAVAKFGRGWLLKPLTFMNDSGTAVAQVSRFFKVEPAEMAVVYDDVDLPLGRLRLRGSGSAGGHNGIRSLIRHLSTDAFARVKIGIGSAQGRPEGERMVGHVLGKFSQDEQPQLRAVIDRGADAVESLLQSGLDATMNVFNRKDDA